jgi:hypothetical protein
LRVSLGVALCLPRAASPQGSPEGTEFVVNTHTTGAQFVAFGQRYASAGGALGAEFRVNSYTSNSQRNPAVAAAPSGDFVVVWSSAERDGEAYGIAGQRYSQIFPVSLTGFTLE